MKKSLIAFLLIIGVMVLSGCSNKSSEINVSGSTSVAPLMEKLADDYSKKENVTININADGSSAGIKAVSEGVSNIGMSSRDLKDDEKNLDLKEYVIAKDAIALITNKENKVDNLTKDQIEKIFIGKIKNWKEVGGADLPIVVVSREDGSGTRSAFEEILKLVNDDESSKVSDAKPIIANSTGAVAENISGKKGAIGYISLGSVDDKVKVIKVDDVIPTPATVLDNKYLISRPFLLLTKEENEDIKKFMEYISSKEGQEIVSAEGYIKVN